VRLIIDPASEDSGWHGGKALDHANPTTYRGKMLTAKEVTEQGPGYGVDAISEREQDDKEDHGPESTPTTQQHAETQTAQQDTCGANLLFRPAIP
jgi:hypothetical protein